MHRIACGLLLALAWLLATTAPAHADERILSYHADIRIAADGSMTVAEHIRVRAEGDQINHGIYRDFPTSYRDPLRNHYRVAFDMLGAERDGSSEDWHSETRGNGVRVYLGSSATTVPIGEHEYVIRYRTNRQVGFFDDHDELYWNVTGNGWAFPIDAAGAEVHLPQAVPVEQLEASGYTGPQGSREQALTTELEPGGARFTASRALGPEEGLSIVLEFPKGIIAEPSTEQKMAWLLRDNRNLVIGLVGLLILWLYYGWAWNRWGRDPPRGVRIPLYEPPNGDSPAAMRYVREMSFDKTCFSAAILGLAAKGQLGIDEKKKGEFTLTRADTDATLTADEKALHDSLFKGGGTLKLVQANRERVVGAMDALKKSLAAGYEKKYFNTHSRKLWPGVLVTLVTAGTMIVLQPGEAPAVAGFMLLWLSGWSLGTFAIASAAWQATRQADGPVKVAGSAGLWLFALPFIAGEIGGLAMLAWSVGIGSTLAFVILIGTNVAFYQWMKAPTRDGAKLLDRIDGFRWYLGVAEKQELDSRYKPGSRPELFAAYLPYAVALDVENAWADRFADALTPMQMQEARPTWYHGTGDFSSASLASFSSSLSSGLSSAISSSSTSPGSSSGGGGGGSSGGGGGGGGGGGW
jgi:uncharacterized membrane protein YgcG